MTAKTLTLIVDTDRVLRWQLFNGRTPRALNTLMGGVYADFREALERADDEREVRHVCKGFARAVTPDVRVI